MPSDIAALERYAVELVARLAPALTDRQRRVLRLAMLELGANAVEWGNAGRPGRVVRIAHAIDGEAVRLRIADDGDGFDPSQAWNTDAEARRAAGKRPGGLGLALIRGLVDDLAFNARGNECLLTIRIRAGGAC